MSLTYHSLLFVVLEKTYILYLYINRFIIYKTMAVKRNFSGPEWTFSCKDYLIALFLLSQLTILRSFYMFSFPQCCSLYILFSFKISFTGATLMITPKPHHTKTTQKTPLGLEFHLSQLQYLFYLSLLSLSSLFSNFLWQTLFVITILAMHCQANQSINLLT